LVKVRSSPLRHRGHRESTEKNQADFKKGLANKFLRSRRGDEEKRQLA